MRTLLNPLMMVNKYEKLFTTPGAYSLTLSPGRYLVVCRGAGGAGGTNGTGGGHGGTAGTGGAGAKGDLTTSTVVVSNTMLLNIVVGDGGLTRGNGGNGGMGGARGGRYGPLGADGINGCGGGGGRPSYVITNPQTATENFYGWRHTLTGSSKYIAATKTYYVTYDSPETIYISETERTYTWGAFELTSGTIYTNGQQVFSASDSATISVNISIVGDTVRLTGTATGAFSASVIPLDVSGNFSNTLDVLTQNATPAAGGIVYDMLFNSIGTITSVGTDSIEYDGDTYSRHADIDTSRQIQINPLVFYANGGGGGGGGGSGAIYGRYSGGGGGGGGGGYYYFDTTNNAVVAVNGCDGATGGHGGHGPGYVGVAGNTAQFPSLYSGNGIGWNHGGGAGASGGGATGGGGGYGAGNEGDAWGGGGGGGGGGSADAGGGSGGYGNPGGYGGNGSNYHTTPTAVADENANIGVIGNYGLGGTSGQNGNSGFVYVKRVAWS